MTERPESDFCIEIDFQKGSGSPSRVFRAMSDLIDAFQETDQALIRSLDLKLEPVLLLEDIESGSIRAWIRQTLETLDDDALKSGDIKKVVGTYLVKGKHYIIRFLDRKTDITNTSEIRELEQDLRAAAEETGVMMLPAYEPVPREKLVRSIEKINDALAPLNDDDRAVFIIEQSSVEFNLSLHIAPETIEELITAETIQSVSTMIVKVKKPDFLGASQWEFKWDNRIIPATILDATWLANYQAGKLNLMPGDAIRAEVLTQVQYGFDGEVVATHYSILKVLEVVERQNLHQGKLFEKKTKQLEEQEEDEEPPQKQQLKH